MAPKNIFKELTRLRTSFKLKLLNSRKTSSVAMHRIRFDPMQRIRRALFHNNRVNKFMMRFPVSTSLGITTVKTIVADLFVQYTIDKKRSFREVDWTRTSVFACFGFAYMGGLQYWLYNIVYFKMFPGVTVLSTIKKVAFDQLIKHPILYWPCFYTVQTALQERELSIRTVKLVKEVYKHNIVHDMKATWTVWGPGQIITFGVMPLHLRLPFIATLSFFWVCYLSYRRGDYETRDDKTDKTDKK